MYRNGGHSTGCARGLQPLVASRCCASRAGRCRAVLAVVLPAHSQNLASSFGSQRPLLSMPDARVWLLQVHLCGSFTRWVETVPMAAVDGSPGVYSVVVHLPPGCA